MTFETEGFAGRSAAALQAEQRQRNGELFDFADKCARLALEIAGRLRAVKNRRQLVAGAFFARCVTHFARGVRHDTGISCDVAWAPRDGFRHACDC